MLQDPAPDTASDRPSRRQRARDLLFDMFSSMFIAVGAFLAGSVVVVGSVAVLFGLSFQAALYATIGLAFVFLVLWSMTSGGGL